MPKSTIDQTDLRILRTLLDDGRATNVELAERVNLSPSPCLRRTKRLEQDGVIRGYRADIDRTVVGFALTVFVGLRCAQHSRENADRLGEAIAAIPQVIACHMVSGEEDFLAEIVVRDLAEYEVLLSERLLTLPMVAGIRSNFVLRPLKTNGPLAL